MTDVTVLMAIYNAMPHLPAAVESIRAQTIEDWRMVVVNDGSTDGSMDYLRQLADPRIEIIGQPNRGLGAALNHGLKYCETEFTARMDGDDICYPTRLEEQLAFMRAHPEVGLVGTQIERMGTRRTAGCSVLATEHEQIDSDIAMGRNQMYHPTIMCRTALMKQIGGYWEHPRGEEWDLFLRMGERCKLANLDRVLLSYRVHTGSMTGMSVCEMRRWIEYACECARRRRNGLAEIDYESFTEQLITSPWHQRLARRCEMHARHHYRIGVGEMLGERPGIGRLRLAYSAIWSPALSLGRIKRIYRRVFARVPAPLSQPSNSNATKMVYGR